MTNSIDLYVGMDVHYVKDLYGEHFPAKITRIWNTEHKVVDISAKLSDEINDYRVSTIAYSEEFNTNTWHRIEDEN